MTEKANGDDLPPEWQNISLLRWGGKVLLEPDKEMKLYNTCPVDNFLWICYCWYLSFPDTLNFVKNSPLNIGRHFYEVISLLLSGSFDGAKVKWLSVCNETSYEGATKDGKMLNFYGTDAGLVYDTLSELFERSFDPECTSKNCPGNCKTVHYGCELIYIEGSSNLIEESIATWESGKNRNCPASSQNEPLDHLSYKKNDGYGTSGNPITKYECSGSLIYKNMAFKHTPPLIIFKISGDDLRNKIDDLSIIPHFMIVHGEYFVLAGITASIPNKDHFIAYIYHSKSGKYYYFDALAQTFSPIPRLSLKGDHLSLLVYFRSADGVKKVPSKCKTPAKWSKTKDESKKNRKIQTLELEKQKSETCAKNENTIPKKSAEEEVQKMRLRVQKSSKVNIKL